MQNPSPNTSQLDMFTPVHFYAHTIVASEDEVRKYEADAKSGEDLILELFHLHKIPMAWFNVKGFLPDLNECSIKRGLTNLSSEIINKRTGVLVREPKLFKTEEREVNPFTGKPCAKYQLLNQ